MKRFMSTLCLALVLTVLLSAIAYAACDGKGRSYEVDCYKVFGYYQYAKATQSASCNNGCSVTLDTILTLIYTDGTSNSDDGTSSVKLQVPSGKVGLKASGTFNASCPGYKFPKRTGTDNW